MSVKYTTAPDPSGLLRITAARDIPRWGVVAGDQGDLADLLGGSL